MITAKVFSGKNYCVLGLARSGMATAEALLASGARVTAWDRREEPRAELEGRATIADPLEIDLSGFDGIVVSPGVPLNTHPIAAKAREAGVPVIGDIELFAMARPELPPHKVVGITGTNGKSTTTALVHHICKTAGLPTTMGGNIGLPILAQDPLPEGGVYVLELSSYQIDLTYSLDCDVAVLLNITPDHLDRYDDFRAYAASKMRLFGMQTFPHTAIITSEASRQPAIDRGWFTDLQLNRLVAADWDEPGYLGSAVFDGRAFDEGEEFSNQSYWPSLQGPHNAQNAGAAICACSNLGLSLQQIDEGLRTYPGLPHRMERLGEAHGVLFVNDSKATNPASTAPALAAYPPEEGQGPRVHWICGGLAKDDNLDDCAPHFGNVACAYTIGEAGPMFADLLEPYMAVERCELLAEAVSRAVAAATPGDVILFSPACASFDQFRDYEARGDSFRELAAQIGCNASPAECGFDTRSAA
ncbi:UDP-N-acetylmuramoyl-L-alanine--D-glutamate ligase [Aurantiacibacter gilvus]|uniref:UDP-N-acetylmuramoylalanine--D-glutamate ligase n=1 Tax=Aurantiacibacter gilvus TaxID=3139141 RepID=A0ABU9IAV8_9SPHN